MVAVAATARAQAPVTLRVQVTIDKFQGEKKISSLPYTLTVTADGARSNLRMGTRVPVATNSIPTGPDGKSIGVPVMSYNYQDVGTSIDCQAHPPVDGSFKIVLSIEDSAIVGPDDHGPAGAARSDHPAFRSFRSSNTLLLRDGQSSEYTMATDKVSGEVVKAHVTATVVK
jgi:hypothetical protein